jgi:hypothetical protein
MHTVALALALTFTTARNQREGKEGWGWTRRTRPFNVQRLDEKLLLMPRDTKRSEKLENGQVGIRVRVRRSEGVYFYVQHNTRYVRENSERK